MTHADTPTRVATEFLLTEEVPAAVTSASHSRKASAREAMAADSLMNWVVTAGVDTPAMLLADLPSATLSRRVNAREAAAADFLTRTMLTVRIII